MTRTAKRITATGILDGRVAALYAGILFTAGLAILLWGTNIIVVIIGVLGALLYDTAYTLSKAQNAPRNISRHDSGRYAAAGWVCGPLPAF